MDREPALPSHLAGPIPIRNLNSISWIQAGLAFLSGLNLADPAQLQEFGIKGDLRSGFAEFYPVFAKTNPASLQRVNEWL